MLNKLINYDLKNLSNWLNANRIMLNVTKTELVIFKPKHTIQNTSAIKRLTILQKKALKLMNFKPETLTTLPYI